MRKIFLLIALFVSYTCSSQFVNFISRNNAGDTSYGTHYDTLQRGGYQVVQNKTVRNAIPYALRKKGMWVKTAVDDSVFNWDGSNWQAVVFSGGGESVVSINRGGTGSSTASIARDSLGVPYAQVYDLVGKFIIACWGDSFTQGAGSSGGANLDYPNQLSSISGFSNYNGGIGGQSSGQIATRMLADIPKHGYPTIIWAGRNNFTDTATVKADIAAMVSALGSNPNYLVLSIMNGSMGATEMKGGANYDIIIALNKALERTYGSHYFDIRKAVVDAYNPSIPYDVYCYNQDIPPLSLRGDSLHLNDAGYLVVAQKVFENLSQLTNPVITAGIINYLFKNPLKLTSTLQVDSTLTVLREINSGEISANGGVKSSGNIETFRGIQDNAYISFYNSANTTRTGYLQAHAGGSILLNAENATEIILAGAPVTVLNQNLRVTGGKAIIGSTTDAGTGALQVTGTAAISGDVNVAGAGNVSQLNVVNTGAFTAGGDAGQYALVAGANKNISYGVNSGQFFVVANDSAVTAGHGGSIALGATYLDGTSNVAISSVIKSGRNDGVSGNYGGYLSFYVRPDGTPLTEKLRLTSSGNLNLLGGNINVIGKGNISDTLSAGVVAKTGGTSSQFLKANGSVDATDYLPNPLTTTGDIIYSSSGSTAARLPIGTSNQVLTVSGGVPTWQTPAAGTASSGVYTPTLSIVSNLTSASVLSATYLKIDRIVHVSMQLLLQPTVAGNSTFATITLPFNSSTVYDAGNVTGGAAPTLDAGVAITNSATQMQISLIPSTTSNASYFVTYQYQTP